MANPSSDYGPVPGPPPPRRPVPSPNFTPSIALGRRALFLLVAVAVCAVIGYALAHFPLPIVAGALLALIGALAIFRHPFLGLILYLILFILRLGEQYPILAALRLERLIGTWTLVTLALRGYSNRGRFKLDTSKQTKVFLIFIGAIVLSIPFSYWRGHSVAMFVEILKALGLYIMTVYLIDSRRKLLIFSWAYLLCVLYLNASSLMSYYSGNAAFAQGIDRATGTNTAAGNANELGTTLACTFPMYLLFALGDTSRWRRLVAGSLGLAAVWGMILTGSRASLLGFLGGLIYLWWHSGRRLLLAVVGIFVLALGFSVMPQQYKGRYETIGKAELDQSSQARVYTWLTGLQMVIDRPVFGVGAGCFGAARAMHYSPEFKPVWLESHSLYIQVVTELGLVGAIAFFAFITQLLRLNRRVAVMLEPLRPGWKLERSLTKALFTGIIILLISGVFGHSLYRRTWYLYAGLGLALYRILLKERGSPAAPAAAGVDSVV